MASLRKMKVGFGEEYQWVQGEGSWIVLAKPECQQKVWIHRPGPWYGIRVKAKFKN